MALNVRACVMGRYVVKIAVGIRNFRTLTGTVAILMGPEYKLWNAVYILNSSCLICKRISNNAKRNDTSLGSLNCARICPEPFSCERPCLLRRLTYSPSFTCGFRQPRHNNTLTDQPEVHLDRSNRTAWLTHTIWCAAPTCGKITRPSSKISWRI